MANKSSDSKIADACRWLIHARGFAGAAAEIEDGLFGPNTAQARRCLRRQKLRRLWPAWLAVGASFATIAGVVVVWFPR